MQLNTRVIVVAAARRQGVRQGPIAAICWWESQASQARSSLFTTMDGGRRAMAQNERARPNASGHPDAREPRAARADSRPTAPSRDAPSAVPVAPALSLPRGGGAIRGIDEKLSTNLATGTASFRVPIATSHGRGGFALELGLSYDSGAGNGPFGLGWRESLVG